MRSWIVVADEGAHPRVGGENLMDFGERLGRTGSSPRRRGKPPDTAVGVSRERLIPA